MLPLFLPHAFLYICLYVGILTRCKIFEEYLFVNYTTFGYFYDIVGILAMISILVLVNVFPVLGRYFNYPLYIVFIISYLYVALLLMNYSFKGHVRW